MEPDELTKVATQLSSILGDTSLLIGGLAVSAWGHVRATEDVDFVSQLEPQELRERLSSHGISSELRRGDVLKGDIPWVLHGKIGSVSFQVLPPLVAIAWDKSTLVRLPDGGELRIVSLQDLLHLKVRAGGSRDLWDVAELVRLNPDMRELTRTWASDLDRLDELDSWLDDPRLG